MLPRLRWDLSLHLNYGALATSLFILLCVAIALVLRAAIGLTLVLWPIPIFGYVVAFIIGRANEAWQQHLNTLAIAAGQPPPHSIEVEDWQKTAWGGAMVAAPCLVILLAA